MIENKIKDIHYLIKTNNLEEARNNIYKLLENNPQDYDLINLIGLVEAKKENYKNAIDFFKQTIVINPKLIGGYINIGVAYEKLDNLTESIKYLKKASKINPSLEIVFSSLAKVFLKSNKYKEAILNFKKAIKINPTNSENYFNLGNALSNSKDYKNAISNYKKVLDSNNNFGDINFLIAENFRKMKKIKDALKFYNKSNHEKKTTRILECYLFLKLKNEYSREINLLKEKFSDDRRIAAVSAYISNQFNIKNDYPFCPNPLDFIYKSNIKKYFTNSDNYISELFNEITNENFKWEPSGKTTVNGYGTVGNLSDKKLPNMSKLEKIIMKEIKLYYLKYKSQKIKYISNWPVKFKIVSWSNRLKKEGHNISHIHPSGWISGVFYLMIPSKIKGNEAGIEFSLYGDDYLILNKNIPKTSIQPKTGDMILFPSSLFHRTIPFSSSEERVCIAFDLCKVS